MANLGNAVIDASRPVGAADDNNLLVDLEGARGFFSGKLIDYRMPCTATEDRTCQIVANLTVWNEFLCPLQLELQELPETGRQLGLVVVHNTCLPQPKRRLDQAATVLYWLLCSHHCVARINITHVITYRGMAELCIPVLCKTLDGNPSLKSVILRSDLPVEFECKDIKRVLKVISSLKCLEEVEFPHCSAWCLHTVSDILRNTTTLTLLNWCSVEHVQSTIAKRFLTVLKTNSTLRDLSLSAAVISASPTLFVEFLTGDAQLQHLRVVSNCDCCADDSWGWIFKGMLKNQSVLSLQAENVTMDFETAELASNMLAENRVLRSFRLLAGPYVRNTPMWFILSLGMPPDTTAFQEAIARNTTLQYMTVNFSIWSAEDWGPFFRVLSEHTSLKMVTVDVEKEEEYRLLPGVIKALQESGCEDKVLFKAPDITDELAVADCKPFCELRVEICDRTTGRILPLMEQLSTFSRLRELSLTLASWDCTIFPAISEYIAMTSTLRKLCVELNMRVFAPELVEWWPELSKSLLLNRSITDFGVGILEGRCQNVALLGDAVMRSLTIRKLSLMLFHPLAFHAFLRGLRADISNNYALCSVTKHNWRSHNLAADWFAVRDTSRRNSGFVARAAQFLNHARCDRPCAAALDRVSRHTALVAELAEVLSIGDDEAARMVRRRFRSIEGLDDFMRLTGVVKQRVTCQPREHGRTQLDDLNSECWSHVRRYLLLDDVVCD